MFVVSDYLSVKIWRVSLAIGLLGRCSLFIMVSHYFALQIFGRVLSKVLHTDTRSVFQGLVLGVSIVCAYFLYFKMLSMFKLNHRVPDFLGGFKDFK